MRYSILLVYLILLVATPSSATTYVVHPDGTGDFPTIQAAIDACADEDIIELTDGIFTRDGNRDIDFLGKAIAVRSRSGNPEACIIDCQGSEAHPHRGFWFHRGEDAEARLDGLQITNGYGSPDPNQSYSHGGAIDCDLSSPSIADCVVSGNSATYAGGGVACWASSPTLTGCSLRRNAADMGAAMFCRQDSHPTLTDCVFVENAAHNSAGAIFCWTGCSPVLTCCTFTANESGLEGGAVRASDGFASVLTECTFVNNTGMFGGAMLLSGSEGPVFARCSFLGNIAHRGGALELYLASPTLYNCSFCENEADYAGGAIYSWLSPISLVDCTLVDNVADRGGGLSVRECSPSIRGCTLSGCASATGGAGVRCGENSLIVLDNSIIAFSEQGGAILCADGSSSAVLTCCDIYGNAGGDWEGCIADQCGINGNISEDPLFCDPDNGDFTLQDCSPCAPSSPPNPECDRIGAWAVGCGGSPTIESTWGAMKALFRQ